MDVVITRILFLTGACTAGISLHFAKLVTENRVGTLGFQLMFRGFSEKATSLNIDQMLHQVPHAERGRCLLWWWGEGLLGPHKAHLYRNVEFSSL
jgi:hypothetical protein